MRQQLFHMSFSWPWVGIRGAIGNLHRNPNEAEIVGGEELFATLLALGCAIVSWIKLRPSYATWISCNWILVASVTFIESMPRYALTMFPIFILFGLLAKAVLVGRDHSLVNSSSRDLQQSFYPRLVGVLTLTGAATASRIVAESRPRPARFALPGPFASMRDESSRRIAY